MNELQYLENYLLVIKNLLPSELGSIQAFGRGVNELVFEVTLYDPILTNSNGFGLVAKLLENSLVEVRIEWGYVNYEFSSYSSPMNIELFLVRLQLEVQIIVNKSLVAKLVNNLDL